jgi:hypothetical protein
VRKGSISEGTDWATAGWKLFSFNEGEGEYGGQFSSHKECSLSLFPIKYIEMHINIYVYLHIYTKFPMRMSES